MILTLFGFLVLVSLVLIIIGLTKPSESAQALIGFFFLFLLSFTLINGSLQVETGANLSSSYTYVGGELTASSQFVDYNYHTFDDLTSRRLGTYMAIGSAVGFAGVMFGIGRSKWGNKQ